MIHDVLFLYFITIYTCVSFEKKYTKQYTYMYLNIYVGTDYRSYYYLLCVCVCVWRNYNNNDDNNVFPSLFQRFSFQLYLSLIYRALLSPAHSKQRLNAVCQPFKTDFQTCKQLDFDASLWTAFCIRLS